MYRLTVLATGLLLAMSAFAGQGSEAQPVAAAAVPATPAAADKVYPPLPSLAMLPPATDDDDEPPARPSARKKKARAQSQKWALPAARLVVSDASHAYLGNIEKQLDLALAR
ncbi:MAG: hypothetical protein ABSD12_16180 [Paraburkholderia sp.]|jgi:hypothetical protein